MIFQNTNCHLSREETKTLSFASLSRLIPPPTLSICADGKRAFVLKRISGRRGKSLSLAFIGTMLLPITFDSKTVGQCEASAFRMPRFDR